MGNGSDKGDTLPAAILKSKAGEKLADTIRNAVDYTVGPKRIVEIAMARADAALVEAKARTDIARIEATADLEISELKAEAAARLLDKEMRNQRNIRAIVGEAYKALPAPEAPVSDEPVSEDFIYRFFDDCEGISEAQMQQIWGKLLAGEVVRPGSFHPRTLGIVKDMRAEDVQLFIKLCRFALAMDGQDLRVLLFDHRDPLYAGLSFDDLRHLESLGLISYSGISGYGVDGLPPKFSLPYGNEVLTIELREGVSQLDVDEVLLTEAGVELSRLCGAAPVAGFLEHVAERWRRNAHTVTIVTRQAAAS
jgi:hypothetical protein